MEETIVMESVRHRFSYPLSIEGWFFQFSWGMDWLVTSWRLKQRKMADDMWCAHWGPLGSTAAMEILGDLTLGYAHWIARNGRIIWSCPKSWVSPPQIIHIDHLRVSIHGGPSKMDGLYICLYWTIPLKRDDNWGYPPFQETTISIHFSVKSPMVTTGDPDFRTPRSCAGAGGVRQARPSAGARDERGEGRESETSMVPPNQIA